MGIKKILGIMASVVSSVSMASGIPVVSDAELSEDWLVVGGGNFQSAEAVNTVRFVGDEEDLVCDVGAFSITCDVSELGLQPGISYRIEHTIEAPGPDYPRSKTTPFEVQIPASGPSTAGGATVTRLSSGFSSWVQADEVMPFEFTCTAGLPVGLSAAQKENSSWDAWRIVDFDIGDCGQVSETCGIVKALKLKDGMQPIYLRGVMTCQ